MHNINSLKQDFFEEQQKIIQELCAISKNQINPKTRLELFRLMHTLKGNAIASGMDKIALYAHELETELQNNEQQLRPIFFDKINLLPQLLTTEMLQIDQADSKNNKNDNQNGTLKKAVLKINTQQCSIDAKKIIHVSCELKSIPFPNFLNESKNLKISFQNPFQEANESIETICLGFVFFKKKWIPLVNLFDLEKKVRSFIVIIQTFTVDNLPIQFALRCDDLILQEQDRT